MKRMIFVFLFILGLGVQGIIVADAEKTVEISNLERECGHYICSYCLRERSSAPNHHCDFREKNAVAGTEISGNDDVVDGLDLIIRSGNFLCDLNNKINDFVVMGIGLGKSWVQLLKIDKTIYAHLVEEIKNSVLIFLLSKLAPAYEVFQKINKPIAEITHEDLAQVKAILIQLKSDVAAQISRITIEVIRKHYEISEAECLALQKNAFEKMNKE